MLNILGEIPEWLAIHKYDAWSEMRLDRVFLSFPPEKIEELRMKVRPGSCVYGPDDPGRDECIYCGESEERK